MAAGGPRRAALRRLYAVHTVLCDVCGDDHSDPWPSEWALLAPIRLVGCHWADVDTGAGASDANDHAALGE